MNEFYARMTKALHTSSWVNLVKRRDAQLVRVEPAVYVCTFVAVTLSTTVPTVSQIKFQSDSDFAVMYQTCAGAVDGIATNVFQNQCTVQMVDRNTNQSFFNEPVVIASVFGRATFPAIVPVPRVFKPSTQLGFTMFTLGQAFVGYTFQFALIGARLFYAG